MIESVTVTNSAGERLTMNLRDPYKSGLAIIDMDGIGTPKANINMTDIASGDGGVYNSSRIDPRNITIEIKYLWSPSIEAARMRCYRYFKPKDKITLSILTGCRHACIEGIVESNEPNIFDKESGCEISIICPDPYFYAIDDHDGSYENTSFSTVVPKFEFPFTNPVKQRTLETAEYNHSLEKIITYTGDEEIGMNILIHFIGEASDIKIINTGTNEFIHIDTDKIRQISGEALKLGDDIIINTERRHKKAELVRKGVRYNILNALDRPTNWLLLRPGDNLISYSAVNDQNLQFMISFRTSYMGL